MDSMDLTLDDIINLNKLQKRSQMSYKDAHFVRKPNNNSKRRGFTYRDLDEPEEKRKLPFVLSNRTGGNSKTFVRLNISNLAPTVSSVDLEELFQRYNVESATVHFNEQGISVGTGDVHLRKEDAIKAMKDYSGVALDNKILHMTLIDNSRVTENSNRKINLRQKRSKELGKNQNVIQKYHVRSKKRNDSPQKVRRGKQLKSMEDLDAELDAYMKKSM